jgi:hypothetical protein
MARSYSIILFYTEILSVIRDKIRCDYPDPNLLPILRNIHGLALEMIHNAERQNSFSLTSS